MLTDLTERIRSGEAAAVEQAYDAWFTPVINFVYYILYDYDSASDISQEAFLRTVEACRDKKKDVRDFKSYLFGTARNLAMTQLGRQKKFTDATPEEMAFEDPNIFADPARAALLAEQRASVAAATRRLNEHQRVALTLKDIDGWSYGEIADFMGMSRNAVGVLLSRARLKFKKEFRLQEIDAGRLEPACRDLLPIMSAVLDGEATDEEKRTVQDHMMTCPECRECMDEMAGASTTLRSMIPVLPALALKGALLAKAAAFGAVTGAAVTVAAGMSALTKAIIGVGISLMVAGAGVGTYIGVKYAEAGPPPTVKVVRPLEGVSITANEEAGGVGRVSIALAVDNKPTAIEIAVDGKTVKRFDRGPYEFEWTGAPAGPHTIKPTAYDRAGKANPGAAVTFTLALKKKATDKIAFLRNGDLHTVGLDGAGEHQVTTSHDVSDFATSPANGQIALINNSRVMYMENYDGTGLRQVTLPERGPVECAAFSHDGKYIYFCRNIAEPGDTNGAIHVRFERYDIAANKVDVVYRKPEPFMDESIGGIFTDASGDYLYYNHFGSDFPSSRVYKISLKGTPTDTPYLAPQRDVPGYAVIDYQMWSVSSDGAHVSYDRMGVVAPAMNVTECSVSTRATGGGEPTVWDKVDRNAGLHGGVTQLEFSPDDPNVFYMTRESQDVASGNPQVSIEVVAGSLGGQPAATGLHGTDWQIWHVIAVPQG